MKRIYKITDNFLKNNPKLTKLACNIKLKS